MKIIYGKNLTREQNAIVSEISNECGIAFETARLLFYRNIDTIEKVKKFLDAGKDQFYNPYLLSGMTDAVKRITIAKEKGESVLVYGDYDADGVCATSVLYYCLKDFGINARFVVPEREEGYGLNVEKIEKLSIKEKIDLIITVDCGISDGDKINELTKKGYDVIVTDHHEIPDVLPNCTTINPKLDNQEYPFSGLAGCGVAFKLGAALIGEKANDYLDVVALATFADSMDLIDENRAIAIEGLKIFNENIRPCFRSLLADNGKVITAQTLIYALAPRINAGGRMGDALSALRLLTSSNENEIFLLAEKLNQYNLERQAQCDLVYKKAKEIITQNKLYKKEIILVKNSDWQIGVIGIVAARLVEEFARPVIVFAEDNGNLKGSCRSVENFNIYEVLEQAKDYFVAFGGHSQAAGLTITKDNFLKLERVLCSLIKEKYKDISYEKEFYVDWDITDAFDLGFSRELASLEPFGVGNRRPYFTVNAKKLFLQPMKNNAVHYTFNVNNLSILHFNGESDVFDLELPLNKTLIVELSYSLFKGREYVKGILKNYLLDFSNVSLLEESLFQNEVKKLKDTEKIYDAVNDKIDTINVSIRQGFGTLYVLNDISNINHFELNGVNIYINKFPENNFINSVLICPDYLPSGFDRIIYLDNPIYKLNSDSKTFINQDYIENNVYNGVSLDRNVFGVIFNQIKSLSGSFYSQATDLYPLTDKSFDFKTFTVALETFLELGLLYVQNGSIFVDGRKTTQLTNSKIYNTISTFGK